MNYCGSLMIMALCAGALGAETRTISDKRDVRPILSENCFSCHGPDSAARKAKLRLDRFEDATASRPESRPAVTPGQADESELIRRIFATDPDDIMPPGTTHKVLKPEEKELLKRWIAEGATYQPHWAYMRIVRPTVPKVKDKWVRNPIDAFILDKLLSKNINPSREADKPRLL